MVAAASGRLPPGPLVSPGSEGLEVRMKWRVGRYTVSVPGFRWPALEYIFGRSGPPVGVYVVLGRHAYYLEWFEWRSS